ncbi:MAG: MBL fold metallo-hydrolase [Clostridiales Family XIII bacterium]|jgi:metallo-beta-lactamase family protein|nr:MBL fold metallo-hydrolase [Clostridiales Family XIII bacterium]
MKIKFCGAATSVTGSCHLVFGDGFRVLLDCGQFQGSKAQEACNYDAFPFDPAEIDFLLLSHAHIDHCGRIPLLVKRGFSGRIYCTDATADLARIMLRDSAYIHEKEAEWRNRKAARAGKPLSEPLYTVKDAENALQYLTPVMYDQLVEPNDRLRFVFNEAGHILGSAVTELWAEENGRTTKLVYSGDLGVEGRPILRDPKIIKKADCVIMESTYGDRLHETRGTTGIDHLTDIVLATARRGGNVVIPSFAVGRTQELIFEFNRFYEQNPQARRELDEIMFYVDSPMATSATEIFRRNAQVFDDETKAYILKGDNPLDFKNLRFTRTSEESRALNERAGATVILSASGMCDAGRIRHHLKHNLWNPKSSVVFVGYQAEGTLGRALLNGLDRVTLFGEEVCVNAEIHNLEHFSGHADRDGLMDWISGFRQAPGMIYLVHGESDQKRALAERIRRECGYAVTAVEGISEFDPGLGAVVTRQDILQNFAEEDRLVSLREKIANIHGALENILYHTSLVFDSDLPADRILEIGDAVRVLEKDALRLGSAVNRTQGGETG